MAKVFIFSLPNCPFSTCHHHQAFATWVGELEQLADFAGEPPDEVRMAIDLSGEVPTVDLEGDPSEALPDLPAMPELEE